MLRFLRCYYLHFTRHSELLRASLVKKTLINSTHGACAANTYTLLVTAIRAVVNRETVSDSESEGQALCAQ